ncbi:MAG: glycosyltransferase family 39 protein [Polyangiaceae bacterium]
MRRAAHPRTSGSERRMTLMARLRRLAESPTMPWLAAALAIVLSWPSLRSGFATEDFMFRVATQKPFDLAHVNLFDAQDVRGGVRAAQTVGSLPWIAPPDFHISFWRPLTSLTHHFDYRLFRDSPWVAHVHSLLWYVIAIFAVGAMLRRWVTPRWAASLATLWWAIDDAHGHAVGWISNRHVILGTAFAAGSLWLMARAEASRRRRDVILSAAAFGVALLCSESALGAWGFLLAQLLLWQETRAGLRALLPHAVITAAWLATFIGLGHGARGSGLYIDPRVEPLAYLLALPERVGVLLLGTLGMPSAETWHGASTAAVALLALGGFAALALVATCSGGGRRAVVLGVGLVLSLLPAAATFPSDRLSFLPGIGALGLAAWVVYQASRHPSALGRIVAGFSLVIHTVIAPLTFPSKSLTMAALHRDVIRASDSAYAATPAEARGLVVLDSPNFYFCKLLREVRWARGLPAAPIACLSGSTDVRFERVDPNALRVTAAHGFLTHPFNRLYRDARHPLRAGQKLFTGALGVEIERVDAQGEPIQVVFRFLVPLEDPRFAWVAFDHGVYRRVEPPAVGHSMTSVTAR